MPQTDVMAWLHRAIGDLPKVTAHSHPLGGTEFQLGDVTLGHIDRCGIVELDASPNGATEDASFEALDIAPSIRLLDGAGTSSLRSNPPGP